MVTDFMDKTSNEIRLSKEDLVDISPQDMKLMSELEKRTLDFINFELKMQKQIDQKRRQVINRINSCLNNPNPKVKMYAANLYSQINK